MNRIATLVLIASLFLGLLSDADAQHRRRRRPAQRQQSQTKQTPKSDELALPNDLGTSSTSTPVTQRLPNRSGVFYDADGAWLELEGITPAQTKGKNFVLGTITMGAVKHRMVNVYRGEEASIKMSESKPTFYVSGIDVSSRSTIIVRLKKSKGNREAETARVGFAGTGSSYGYKESDIVEVFVNRESNNVVNIIPRSSLPSGEYILVLSQGGDAERSYDFGIR